MSVSGKELFLLFYEALLRDGFESLRKRRVLAHYHLLKMCRSKSWRCSNSAKPLREPLHTRYQPTSKNVVVRPESKAIGFYGI